LNATQFTLKRAAAAIVLSLTLPAIAAWAIDPPRPRPAIAPGVDPEKSGGTGSSSSSAAAEEPDAKPPRTISEKLLKSVEQNAEETESGVDRLERAISGMRDASKRITATDTGSETQKLQARVVEDLELLLQQMKQQQRRQQSSSQSQSMPQDRQNVQPRQLDPKNSAAQQPQPMDAAAPRNRRDDPSRNAQENVNAAQRARDEEARREQMVKDVWGHLPPHLRDAMLQSFREKYLPQYEDLVRRYYEALAEKSRSGSTDR
jgi:hypothetical protein